MANIISVAKYIFENYKKKYNETIDEMKLHKLLYFAQRESFAMFNKPLFQENLEGWKLGPVSPIVRSFYPLLVNNDSDITNEEKELLNNVIDQYGCFISTKLSEMTHSETSWINSRKGLMSNENGSVPLSLDDIKKDSEKVRPYCSLWDTYYDELEDKKVALV